jgi:hypothetical protein
LKSSSGPTKKQSEATNASDYAEERRLIHEMANHLTIIQGAVVKALRTLHENPAGMDGERERLQKAEDYVKKSIQTLNELRAQLQSKTNHGAGT